MHRCTNTVCTNTSTHPSTLIFISTCPGCIGLIWCAQAPALRHAHYHNPYKKSTSLSHPGPESCHQVLSKRLLYGDWSWSFGPGSRDLCCVVPSPPELIHSSDCNEALIKCTLIRSLLKSIFSLVFVITSPCSISGSATQAQWLPKGPKEMSVGLDTSTRSFLGEPGQEAGLVQPCSDIWTQPLQGLCVMAALSLQGNKSCSGSKTQSAGVLGLIMQRKLPEGDLVVLVKKKTSFLQQILHCSSQGRLSDKANTKGLPWIISNSF